MQNQSEYQTEANSENTEIEATTRAGAEEQGQDTDQDFFIENEEDLKALEESLKQYEEQEEALEKEIEEQAASAAEEIANKSGLMPVTFHLSVSDETERNMVAQAIVDLHNILENDQLVSVVEFIKDNPTQFNELIKTVNFMKFKASKGENVGARYVISKIKTIFGIDLLNFKGMKLGGIFGKKKAK